VRGRPHDPRDSHPGSRMSPANFARPVHFEAAVGAFAGRFADDRESEIDFVTALLPRVG